MSTTIIDDGRSVGASIAAGFCGVCGQGPQATLALSDRSGADIRICLKTCMLRVIAGVLGHMETIEIDRLHSDLSQAAAEVVGARARVTPHDQD